MANAKASNVVVYASKLVLEVEVDDSPPIICSPKKGVIRLL